MQNVKTLCSQKKWNKTPAVLAIKNQVVATGIAHKTVLVVMVVAFKITVVVMALAF